MPPISSVNKLPGELVTWRVSYTLKSSQLGIVVAQHSDERLVLWTIDDGAIELSWHVDDALLVIDNTNISSVISRQVCILGG